MDLTVVNIIALSLSILLFLHGLLHQFIVGAALSIDSNHSEQDIRIMLMAWVAQGAFISFAGILPAVILIFFEPSQPLARTIFVLCAAAMLILAVHGIISGIKTHPKPVLVGIGIEIIYSLYFLGFALL